MADAWKKIEDDTTDKKSKTTAERFVLVGGGGEGGEGRLVTWRWEALEVGDTLSQ